MRIAAHIISLLFHPIFMIGYMLVIMLYINPYNFGFVHKESNGVVLISILSLSILLPIVAIILMKATGLIESIQLKTAKERIAPLAATGVFYLWLYVNIKNNTNIAPSFIAYVLGTIIGLFLALLLNAFSKISLHAMGIAGLFAATASYIYTSVYTHITIEIGHHIWAIDTYVILIAIVLIAGMIASSRLLLNAHTPYELYGGSLIGVCAQFLAFGIFIP